jgi:hypothetical protein
MEIAIYVPQYIDPNWEPSTKDLEVKRDMNQIEMVLTRKGGLPAPTPPAPDEDQDSAPD